MQTLLEKYKTRLAVADKVYQSNHSGSKLTEAKKLITAKCIDNVSKFMNEAFDNSTGTQRADLGLWKKFTLNLTTVALPNLIAPEIVLTSPMSSMSGYVTYLNYTAGTNKGAIEQGDVFNGVYTLDPDNKFAVQNKAEYTSERVTEVFEYADADASTHKTVSLSWKTEQGIPTKTVGGTATTGVVAVYKYSSGAWSTTPLATSAYTVDSAQATVTLGTALEDGEKIKVAYIYDNVYIPQNDLPILNVKVESIPLIAHARRIAVYYSQIAQFQAKTDYGFDLGDQLAEQAVGALSYEIDTEVVNLLSTSAEVQTELQWSRTLPVGVSKTEHYEGFAEVLGIGKQLIYDRTKKFAPNYMLIASNILPIFSFIKSWQPAPAGQINGPYFAGTLDGIKVYVSPAMAQGEFVLGVNGSDMMTSAAVYAPYMPIVPTQLLQYADGGTSQGFSTLYDLKLLSKYTGVDGKEYSPLLVKGIVS